MKAKALTAILVVGIAFQAAAMGHPHNLFAARKQINAKRTTALQSQGTGTHSGVLNCVKSTALSTASVWHWLTKKGTK